METIVLVIHLILAIALVGVVLLQRSEGGGLGIGGGGGGLMSVRGTANLLTRATGVLAASIFHWAEHSVGAAKQALVDGATEDSR